MATVSDNLPPGCSIDDIPGNRPRDIAEEKEWERLTSTDITETCWEKRGNCSSAAWRECVTCKGTGTDPVYGHECDKCHGAGQRFSGCEHGIVNEDDEAEKNSDPALCEWLVALVDRRLEERRF
jgi:hypothetical protein